MGKFSCRCHEQDGTFAILLQVEMQCCVARKSDWNEQDILNLVRRGGLNLESLTR